MKKITVTATITYTYEMGGDSFVQSEADAIADVQELLYTGGFLADDFDFTTEVEE